MTRITPERPAQAVDKRASRFAAPRPHTFAAIGDSITALEPTLMESNCTIGPSMAGDVPDDWRRYATGGYTLAQIRTTHLPSRWRSGRDTCSSRAASTTRTW